MGYSMISPCDGFGRTPETVAQRQGQGAALGLVRRSLAAVTAQRITRGFLARRKVQRLLSGDSAAIAEDASAATCSEAILSVTGSPVTTQGDDNNDDGDVGKTSNTAASNPVSRNGVEQDIHVRTEESGEQ